jgi:hypothetical protein
LGGIYHSKYYTTTHNFAVCFKSATTTTWIRSTRYVLKITSTINRNKDKDKSKDRDSVKKTTPTNATSTLTLRLQANPKLTIHPHRTRITITKIVILHVLSPTWSSIPSNPSMCPSSASSLSGPTSECTLNKSLSGTSWSLYVLTFAIGCTKAKLLLSKLGLTMGVATAIGRARPATETLMQETTQAVENRTSEINYRHSTKLNKRVILNRNMITSRSSETTISLKMKIVSIMQ